MNTQVPASTNSSTKENISTNPMPAKQTKIVTKNPNHPAYPGPLPNILGIKYDIKY